MQAAYRKSARKSSRRDSDTPRGRVVRFDASGETATVQLAFPMADLLANLQRCQVHKQRNILEHLPKKHHATVRMKLRAAWGMKDYSEARAALGRVVEHLRTLSEGAAKSLEEAFEETLTLHRLGVSEALRKSLQSTNGIENCFSVTRKGCRNVKRWRSAEMAWRWAGSVLLDVEARFRRVRGFRDLGHLLEALGRTFDERALDNRREVA